MYDLLNRLQGAVWHVTRPDRFEHMMADGAILPEPDIPERERWATARGPDYYPYARYLGGISLFDFRNVDNGAWQRKCRTHSLSWFLSLHRPFSPWRGAVWIEVDPAMARSDMIAAPDLARDRVRTNQTHRMLMPGVESAHIGPLHLDNIASFLLVGCFRQHDLIQSGRDQFHHLDIAAIINSWRKRE